MIQKTNGGSQNSGEFEDLLVDELSDIYDAEKQILKTMPNIIEKIDCEELKECLNEHFQETQDQVGRLDKIFNKLGKSANGKTCAAMRGLVADAEQLADATGDQAVVDAALIAAAQLIEHYEIAAYGTARTYAELSGRQELARMLQEALEEEYEADEALSRVAESKANESASASRSTRRGRRAVAASQY